MTGPSFTSDTCMCAPKRPVATVAPRSRSAAANSSTRGSATAPECRGRPGGPPALRGIGVEGELADHQDRRAQVGGRAFALQNAQAKQLVRQRLRERGGIGAGDAHQGEQAVRHSHRGRVDLAHHLVVDRDPGRADALYQDSHAPIIGYRPPRWVSRWLSGPATRSSRRRH